MKKLSNVAVWLGLTVRRRKPRELSRSGQGLGIASVSEESSKTDMTHFMLYSAWTSIQTRCQCS